MCVCCVRLNSQQSYVCVPLAGWLSFSLSVLLCLSAIQQIILSLPHTLYVYHRWCMCECVSLSLDIFLFVFYSFCHRSAEFAVVVVVITIIQQIGGKVHIHKALSELSKIQFITACWSEHKHTGETQKIFEPELIFLAAFLVIAALDIVYVILWEIFEEKKTKRFRCLFFFTTATEKKNQSKGKILTQYRIDWLRGVLLKNCSPTNWMRVFFWK